MSSIETDAFDGERVTAVQRRMPADGAVQHLAEIFGAMGDPTRLSILFALSKAELCVHDLATMLPISISAVSHQLRLLRGLRLVKLRREGRFAYYSLDDHHVAALLEMGLEHVCDAMPAPLAADVPRAVPAGGRG